MNERIKELAEQAGFDLYEDGWIECGVLELERFAELVRQDERESLQKEGRLKFVIPKGCNKQLANGQWWHHCGDSDYGSMPALCTKCGGEYKLAIEEQA